MLNRRNTLSFISSVALGLGLGVGYAAAENWTIGFSQDTMDHPWRAYMVTSAEAQAKNYPAIKEFI